MTRVFPFVSEVTLITDKEQAVPVQILRTGQRSVVFRYGRRTARVTFLPANVDVQEGDMLVTSGLDGVSRTGIPVAKVTHIERDTSYTFARVLPAAWRCRELRRSHGARSARGAGHSGTGQAAPRPRAG